MLYRELKKMASRYNPDEDAGEFTLLPSWGRAGRATVNKIEGGSVQFTSRVALFLWVEAVDIKVASGIDEQVYIRNSVIGPHLEMYNAKQEQDEKREQRRRNGIKRQDEYLRKRSEREKQVKAGSVTPLTDEPEKPEKPDEPDEPEKPATMKEANERLGPPPYGYNPDDDIPF